MERRTYHHPAMAPQEAALLPAIAPVYPTMPLREADFRPLHNAGMPQRKRGSAAGRAVLHAYGVHLPGIFKMHNTKNRCP